jgi:ATP-independent RNA helicase DbpA
MPTPPAPTGFASLGLSASLSEVVRELGFTAPTPVQAQAIPLLLQQKDLIGQSQTGSGKTAAFALPLLERLGARPGELRDRRVRALVLSPTRELCAQVAREMRKLGRRIPGLQVLVLSGGAPIGPQLDALERGVHVIVGTPGRVLDHLTRRSLDLSRAETLVLDEADRMLEMGFEEDMERILERLPRKRQTVLFSATFPRTIEAMSRRYQRDPARVTIEAENQAAKQVRQVVFEVAPEDRLKALLWVIEQNRPDSVIVFCNLKATVAALEQELKELGLSVGALHGDLEQSTRDRVMAKFRNRSLRILVATDVAARGIDVDGLDAVVCFDLPAQAEVYVHRVGRTGRAGKSGLAISFYSKREVARLAAIEQYAGIELKRKTAVQFDGMDIGSLRDRVHVASSSVGSEPSALPPAGSMKTLFIGAGRKDKMRPGDILGALTGEAGGLPGTAVGKIEVHDRFSYVAVSAQVAAQALDRLRAGRIKGKKFRIEAVR